MAEISRNVSLTPSAPATAGIDLALAIVEHDHDAEVAQIVARPVHRSPSEPNLFWDVADRVRDHPAWRYHEIDSNHMVPQNRPREFADVLPSLA